MNYRKLSDAGLDRYIESIMDYEDDEGNAHPDLAGAEREADLRAACKWDSRIAQGMGYAVGEMPS